MKKILFVLALLLSISNLKASNADLFTYDENKMNDEMSSLNELEAYVSSHEGINYSDLCLSNKDLVSDISYRSSFPTAPEFAIDDIDWGAFAWGFCCWPVGFFTVILNKSKDNNSKISFFIGLGTSVVLSIPGYLYRASL